MPNSPPRRRGAGEGGSSGVLNLSGADRKVRNWCKFSSDGTDREISANFDRQASATNSVLFLGLSPPKANKTVSFFVSFHQGATQSGILFLVSIAPATARRIYHCRPWLSDVSHLSLAFATALPGAMYVTVIGLVSALITDSVWLGPG